MGMDMSARIIDTPASTLASAASMVRRGTRAYVAITDAARADLAYRTNVAWTYHTGQRIESADAYHVRHYIIVAMSIATDHAVCAMLARAFVAASDDAYATVHAPNALAPRV
jgi:hypothetical protein